MREFVEALVHLIGNHHSNPDDIRVAGTISLDASGRLDQFYWQRLRTMVTLSERSFTDTWVGFAWQVSGTGALGFGVTEALTGAGVLLGVAALPRASAALNKGRLILLGFAVWQAHAPGYLLVAAFCVYLTELQIKPEERALEERFGAEYSAYKSTVRRWI